MSREELKSNVQKENVEVRKLIETDSQTNELKEHQDSMLQEEELMSTNKRRIRVGIVTFVIILVVAGLLYFIYPKEEQEPEPTTTEQEEKVVSSEVVEEVVAEETTNAEVDTEEEATDEITTKEAVEGENATKEIETEEITSDDTVVEMMDWEIWATQPDNDEICVVVWNEENHVQKIIENEKKYIVQEGDKLAVPRRENIMKVSVDEESQYYNLDGYVDIVIDSNELVTIEIIYKNDRGEYEINKYYLQKAE